MTGSVIEGEDVVQEALFEAYRNLDTFDASRPLKPWLFQIAHNRCIDFLRKHAVRVAAETASATPDMAKAPDPASPDFGRAIERLVINLPPKERACVLLKDVFDYSLEEVAEMVDSTVGGVKAALHRGRTKLAASQAPPRPRSTVAPELNRVIQLYVDRFNRRDWNGLRELISADARLTVVDAFDGRLVDSPYFSNYERLSKAWKMAAGEVDGELAVVRLDRGAYTWTPSSLVLLNFTGKYVDRIVDYSHCPWIISAASYIACAHPN
jgi:RNA polymerase sigma-70 factor (ECF subfamily)